MGILQSRTWLIKVTGLLVVICVIAGGFLILKSGNFLDYISEVSANVPSHEIINNDQENTSLVASNSYISEYLPNTSFDSLSLKDPYIEQQWALERIKAADLWLVIDSNSGINIAILDTGIDKDHEDLAGIVVAEINFTDSPTLDDINGHGTHIAGIIAANRNNKGIAGLASGVYLMNVKVADDAGRCRATDVARGIIWAVDNGAKIINISLELTEPSEDLSEAVEYAWNKGALIVAAAGNNASDVPVYPAGYEDTIAVAALTIDNCLAPLSNHGGWVDVAAPGMNIYSLLPDNKYGYKTGTSFAAAYVSGLAAVLFNIAVDLNGNGCINDEVRYAIESSCDKIGLEEIGNGCINVAAALAMLQ
jgi:thermitase